MALEDIAVFIPHHFCIEDASDVHWGTRRTMRTDPHTGCGWIHYADINWDNVESYRRNMVFGEYVVSARFVRETWLGQGANHTNFDEVNAYQLAYLDGSLFSKTNMYDVIMNATGG